MDRASLMLFVDEPRSGKRLLSIQEAQELLVRSFESFESSEEPPPQVRVPCSDAALLPSLHAGGMRCSHVDAPRVLQAHAGRLHRAEVRQCSLLFFNVPSPPQVLTSASFLNFQPGTLQSGSSSPLRPQ